MDESTKAIILALGIICIIYVFPKGSTDAIASSPLTKEANNTQISVTGQIKNKIDEPVTAIVSFTDEADTTRVFSDTTDSEGYYSVSVVISSIKKSDLSVPTTFSLRQNYPNPFPGADNPGTTIEYSLKTPAKVSLVIYNLLGQKVKTLVNQNLPAGNYRAYWNGKDDAGHAAAAGIYFCQLKTKGFVGTKKMLKLDFRIGNTSFGTSSPTPTYLSKHKSSDAASTFQMTVAGANISKYVEKHIAITTDTVIDKNVNCGPTYIGGLNSREVQEDTEWRVNLNTSFRNDDQSTYFTNIPQITIQDSIATWQPVHGDSSLLNVIFNAVDVEDTNLVAQSLPITLIYQEVNDPPAYLGGLHDEMIYESFTWSKNLSVYFSDEETPATNLSYSVNNPEITIQDSIVSWKPTAGDSNLVNLIFSATDEGGLVTSSEPPISLFVVPLPQVASLIQGTTLVGAQTASISTCFSRTVDEIESDEFDISGSGINTFVIANVTPTHQYSISIDGVPVQSPFSTDSGLLLFDLNLTAGDTVTVRIERIP